MKPIMKVLTICIIGCLLISTGCSYKKDFEQGNQSLGTRNESDVKKVKSYGFLYEGIDHHEMNELRFSPSTATEIARMDGVAASFVVLTDKNAYVAIVTDDSATGTSNRGEVEDQDNSGTSEGTYDIYTNTPYGNPRNLVNDTNSLYTIPDPNDVSSKLRQLIGEKVRYLHPEVMEVFITANMEFVNRLNAYTQDSWRGIPIESKAAEFEKMVRVHFVE